MIDLTRLLSSRNNAFVGMDICRHAVHMVEVSRDKADVLVLQCYGSERLTDGAVSEDSIDDLEHVVDAARRLWERAGFKARKCALGIPASAVVMHTFDAATPTFDSETQRETFARERIAPLLDCHIDDASVDFYVISPAAQAQDFVQIAVAATRKEHIEDRVAIAESLRLQAVVVELDRHAAHAALMQSHSTTIHAADVIALLHLDDRHGRISLHADDRMLAVQEYDEAAALSSPLERTAASAIQALQTLQSLHPDLPASRLILSGSRAMTTGLAETIEKQSGIPTAIANPFAGVSLATGIDAKRLQADAPIYLTAFGLALRCFD